MICFFVSDNSFLQWILTTKVHGHLTAAWILLPIGSIFIAALIVLLMVLFNRCPMVIATLVTAILVIIILFVTLISLDEKSIYT